MNPDMKEYYGTKRIIAWPEERDGKPGYAVKYSDDYVSWSPKGVFEGAYQPINAMNFGHALQAMKEGHRVARAGWNGKGMWVCIIPSGNAHFRSYPMQDCFGMKTANGDMQPGWLASQADMLAEDWSIVT